MSYKGRLKEIGVDYLYHITDRDNLSSIIKGGGISSWERAVRSELIIPRPGGDSISHRLDSRDGLKRGEYVHLYLTPPNESIIKSYKETGRFDELYVLQISIDVIHEDRCVFWMGDPYDAQTECIDNIDVFIDNVESKKELLDSCILDVEDFIPVGKITNLPESITVKITEVHPTAIVFVINQSRSMKKSAILENVEYDYISQLVATIVNEQIEFLLKECTTRDGELNHLFDIAVVGYGDSAYSAWNDKDIVGFQSPFELYCHTKRESNGYRWVDAVASGRTSHCEEGLAFAYNLLSEWMSKRQSKYYYPPTVIHINNGEISRELQTKFLLMSEKIKSLKSLEGNVVLWNIGLTCNQMCERILPSGEEIASLTNLPGAMVMYEASSYLRNELKERSRDLIKGEFALARRTIGINVSQSNLTKILQTCILPQNHQYTSDSI